MKQNIFRSNESRIRHNLEFKSYPWWNHSVSCNSSYRCLVICIGFMDMPHTFSPTIITVSHLLVQSNSWKDVFSLVSLKLNAILICNLVLGGYVLLMKIMVTMFPMSILIGMDLSILRDVMAINLNMNMVSHQYA